MGVITASLRLYLGNASHRQRDTLVGIDMVGLEDQGHHVQLELLDLVQPGDDEGPTPDDQGRRVVHEPRDDDGLAGPSRHNLDPAHA